MEIHEVQTEIGANARDKGFWDAHEKLEPKAAAAYVKLCLIHSEVTEAMEELRRYGEQAVIGPSGYYTDRASGKPEGLWSEVADVVIRCLDMAEWAEVDLGAIIEEKMAYNTGRPAMHGKRA